MESSHVEVAPLPQADSSTDIRAGIGNCVAIGPDFAAHTAPKSLRVSANLKRLIFVVINAWLVAPLPFPAAFILAIPLPNLLAFPWTSADYYSRVASFAAVSFPVTVRCDLYVAL